MKKILLLIPLLMLVPQAASATTIYLTTGSQWTVPSDWNNSNNTIEVIGGGGGSSNGSASAGGGAYSKVSNLVLTPDSSVMYTVGSGGSAGGTTGGDTIFNGTGTTCDGIQFPSEVCAKGGGGAGFSSSGLGGSSASGVGTTKYSGGNGTNSVGGGGAAGMYGAGNVGSGNTGGSGDAGYGGAGGSGAAAGGNGTEWDSLHGSGGGAGRSGGAAGRGGNYGGGGGASSWLQSGGAGAPGIIVITYTPIICVATSISGGVTRVYLRCGSSWTVPTGWNNVTVETIGGGGGASGANALANSHAQGAGGGAYSKVSNVSLTSGSVISYSVGRAGVGGLPGLNAGTAGGDTYFCNSTSNCGGISSAAVLVGAKGGRGARSNGSYGTGGGTASGIGTVKYGGGDGGHGVWGVGCVGGTGGGGAGGPNGKGTIGGNDTYSVGYDYCPPGDGTGGTGGTGDAGFGGIGGIGGAAGYSGNPGSSGSEYGTNIGSGGGGGGQGAGNSLHSGAGGYYGGGAGGTDTFNFGSGSTGGNGAPGIIVITYVPVPPLQCNGTPQIFSTAGTYTRTVPTYGSMTVEAWGGGGGGGACSQASNPGSVGSQSVFGTLIARGGAGGGGGYYNHGGIGGTGGVASGGSTNTNGSVGADGIVNAGVQGSVGGAGGSAPFGGTGGAGGVWSGGWGGNGGSGLVPGAGGGGGSGCSVSGSYGGGGGGGSGGYGKKTYTSSDLSVGSSVTVNVGGGGSGAVALTSGGNGAPGQVKVTCSQVVAPTCSITLNPKTIAYGGAGATLAYSSANVPASNYFQINTVGPVTSNVSRSTTVYAGGNYDGFIKDNAGTTVATCSPNGGTLTVDPPSLPAVTITASSSPIQVGQSTNMLAKFIAASGDPLSATAIDSPAGTHLTSTSVGNKTYKFTPASPGTYTFYARATTGYYTSWTTYDSVTVTVTNPAPQCTDFHLTPSSIGKGQSSTLSWATRYADSGTITNINGPVDPSGWATISPSKTTTYTGTFTGIGGKTSCTPATLTVCTLPPGYSCPDLHTIRHTFADCHIVDTDCPASESKYCFAGVPDCLVEKPSSTDGLRAVPNIVRQGDPTKLFWEVTNVSECTIVGSDDQQFSVSGSSGAGGLQTGSINQQTIFTLTCTGLDESSISGGSAVVNIVPVFQEQ